MDLAVRHLHASAFTIPTDTPEADGTYAWDRTSIVVVELDAGDPGGPRHLAGLGYAYGDAWLVRLISLCAIARDGRLWPDRSRPGLGLELRRADARRFAA